MSEHTKGPWKVGLGHNCVHVLIGSNKIVIGLDKEACANADLIAAAPEMYEAIKAALRIPELWCPVGDPTSENEGEYQALSIMFNNFNEAIIAAEGKDQ